MEIILKKKTNTKSQTYAQIFVKKPYIQLNKVFTLLQLGPDQYAIFGADANIREQKSPDIDISAHIRKLLSMIPQMRFSNICSRYVTKPEYFSD